jgi:Ras-related protein Rab-6A
MYSFKFIIVGEAGSGKTSLMNRFINDKFDKNYDITVGIEMGFSTVLVDDESDGKSKYIKICINDTAGQCAFRSIIKSYFRNTTVAMIVFDISKRNTFSDLDYWFHTVSENRPLLTVLVGAKKDVVPRQVTFEEASRVASSNGIEYFEISSFLDTKEHIHMLFKTLATKALKTLKNIENIESFGIKKTEDPPQDRIQYIQGKNGYISLGSFSKKKEKACCF